MAHSINPTISLSQWNQQNTDATYEIYKPNPDAGITMHAAGGDEMIKVTPEGFYVRGQKVPQDDKEAETVYNAFKQWMAWAALTQQR